MRKKAFFCRLDSLVFRHPSDSIGGFGGSGSVCGPSSVMLPGLSRAHVGSPLLDIYAFLLAERADARGSEEVAGKREEEAEAAEVMLRVYHAAFSSTCGCLRSSSESLSFRYI